MARSLTLINRGFALAFSFAMLKVLGRLAMSRLNIPHNAFVFVDDGRKALFLRNEGDEKFPNLRTEKIFEDENPLDA